MIEFNAAESARLFVAALDGLQIKNSPRDWRDRAFFERLRQFSILPFAEFVAAATLANEIDHLAGGETFTVSRAEVAARFGVDVATAERALRLLNCEPRTRDPDEFENGGSRPLFEGV